MLVIQNEVMGILMQCPTCKVVTPKHYDGQNDKLDRVRKADGTQF